jgi:hypothetical protein
MFGSLVFKSFSRAGSLIMPSTSARSKSGQRGAATLAMALIALMVGTSLAIPAMQLIVGSFTSTTGSSASIDARSAAEHALWRLRFDPLVHDEMIGSPPQTDYILGFPNGDATVSILASSDPPSDNGLTASLLVTPSTIPENTQTTVTYTLTLTNDDTADHVVTRFETNPSGSFGPTYLTGTTTGATTQNPIYQSGEWRWELLTPITVDGFGGMTSISWQMSVNEDDGQYWARGTVRVENVGNVDAPLSSSIRATGTNDLEITTIVTPNEVVAGSTQTYSFTVEVTNNGLIDYTPEFIKHWTSTLFDHVTATTTGMSVADPSRNHDVINNRWEWTWNITGITIAPAASATLQFDMTATLLPNTYFATSGIRVEEDMNANGQETTVSTGDTAPVTVVRSFTITATHNGETVMVIAYVTASGVEVISWIES